MLNRREFLQRSAALAAVLSLPTQEAWGQVDPQHQIRRFIPESLESLPVIGMGSSRTFDTILDQEARQRLLQVLRTFFGGGGALIDSSPMYGKAEYNLGTLLEKVEDKAALFAATKVWIEGKDAGIAQMERSAKNMGVPKLDLIQIHNLVDWRTHVETLKEWKSEGKDRYIGITTSHNRDHEALAKAIQEEKFDFVQFSYNIANRVSEETLLPLAKEQGTAVLINRPFQRGDLFEKVKDRPLPEWAQRVHCQTWAQFFLKFIISHPAVTCVIPATSKPEHMKDNMRAGFGGVPDEEMRQQMIEYFESL